MVEEATLHRISGGTRLAWLLLKGFRNLAPELHVVCGML